MHLSPSHAFRCGGRAWTALLATAILALSHAVSSHAEETGASTPRSAVRAYLEAARSGDYEQAAEHLDLSRLSPAARAARGPQLARELKVVLDRTLWVDLDKLSDVPEGAPDDALPPQRDLVGTIEAQPKAVNVLLERMTGAGGAKVWKIAAATVAQIPALYEQFGYGVLSHYLPAILFDIQFFDVQLWQWTGLLLLIVASAALSWILAALLVRILHPLGARSKTVLDDRAIELAAAPVRLIIGVALFAAGTQLLALAAPVQAFFAALQKTLTLVGFTWLVMRAIDLLAGAAENALLARRQMMATSVVPLGRRAVKALVVAVAILAGLQNFGINVTGVLAGLGIGGLAVALAAQKTVENLFGGLTLIADQPVRVGEFCRFGDRLGTVEEIGLRSTRIRTLDRTLVTIPNAEFAALQLENFSKRDRIWFQTTLGVRYETSPDQLRHLLIELKKLLVSHPKVHPDPARVRFVGFGAYSLDIEIFAYILTSDINEFLAIREDLLLRIADVVAASGTGFAFPSQTIYAAADTGLDSDRRRDAEAKIEESRRAQTLDLPDLRHEKLTALKGALDYPPEGSAARSAR